jgi:hypothetical protein
MFAVNIYDRQAVKIPQLLFIRIGYPQSYTYWGIFVRFGNARQVFIRLENQQLHVYAQVLFQGEVRACLSFDMSAMSLSVRFGNREATFRSESAR